MCRALAADVEAFLEEGRWDSVDADWCYGRGDGCGYGTHHGVQTRDTREEWNDAWALGGDGYGDGHGKYSDGGCGGEDGYGDPFGDGRGDGPRPWEGI